MRNGQQLDSGSGVHFKIQDDGNCVAYRRNLIPYWASNTSYSSGVFLIMQDDGNLCLYKGTGPTDNHGSLWSSKTGNRKKGPYVLCFQSDGSLQIYNGNNFDERHDAFWVNSGWAATTPRCTIMNVDSVTYPSQKFIRPEKNSHDAKIVHVEGQYTVWQVWIPDDMDWWIFIETRVTDPKDGKVKDAVLIQNLFWGRVIAVKNADIKNGTRCVNTEIHWTKNELWFKDVLSSGQVSFMTDSGSGQLWNTPSDTVALRNVMNSDFVFRLDGNKRDTMIETWTGTNLQKWTIAKVSV